MGQPEYDVAALGETSSVTTVTRDEPVLIPQPPRALSEEEAEQEIRDMERIVRREEPRFQPVGP